MVEGGGGANHAAESKPIGAGEDNAAVPTAKEVPPAQKNGASSAPATQHDEKDKEGPCGLPSKCVVL
ncbi:hypothetical protein NKR19_g7269 [Coniochaeta hoffmannii]|uniref:Uncharacterized protein n=1 Tax=Coniochaeta hoffmannii TaxID=91930 RepID=A0AA38VMY9_9PEZI|nr:hypothetical protein NKR19_g7269 [Coniochaeta hoffmannii]